MGRPGITKAMVAEAVTSLRAQGRPTTTKVVRLELGHGSYNTIGRFLDQLGAKSTGKPEQVDEMPHDIQSRLADCALSMWEAVCRAISKAREALTAQYEQRIQLLTRELVRERENRKTAERELSASQQELLATSSREQHLHARVAMLREQIAGEQAVVSRLERDREEFLERLGKSPRAGIQKGARTRGRSSMSGTRPNSPRRRN